MEVNKSVWDVWDDVFQTFQDKVIVLDDDPTGVQTVHGVPVYTDWTLETIERIFQEKDRLQFILTNSRALTPQETAAVHREIATRIETMSQKWNVPYLLISRSDSTLRGHYPLETETLKETIERCGGKEFDGEVILPFFKEGGRLTIDNIHYVKTGNMLIPVGETEFAKDRAFGFQASHLGEWIEEKTKGTYKKDDVTYITIDEIRALNMNAITDKLMAVKHFGKVVVNAIDEDDVVVFTIALIRALNKGKRFLFRTAATFTKVIGNVRSRPLLTKEELLRDGCNNGGFIVIGSYVKKTTEQLKELKTLDQLHFIEFDCHLVLEETRFEKEMERVLNEAENMLKRGVTTVIYTRRERLDLGEGKEEEQLKLSVKISDALTRFVRDLTVRPKYIIAKGGITSSDIGTKGLNVKRAIVAGQIAPGVPVWRTGDECTFPNIPYIIFPGNVGEATTLKEVVLKLEK